MSAPTTCNGSRRGKNPGTWSRAIRPAKRVVLLADTSRIGTGDRTFIDQRSTRSMPTWEKINTFELDQFKGHYRVTVPKHETLEIERTRRPAAAQHVAAGEVRRLTVHRSPLSGQSFDTARAHVQKACRCHSVQRRPLTSYTEMTTWTEVVGMVGLDSELRTPGGHARGAARVGQEAK